MMALKYIKKNKKTQQIKSPNLSLRNSILIYKTLEQIMKEEMAAANLTQA